MKSRKPITKLEKRFPYQITEQRFKEDQQYKNIKETFKSTSAKFAQEQVPKNKRNNKCRRLESRRVYRKSNLLIGKIGQSDKIQENITTK